MAVRLDAALHQEFRNLYGGVIDQAPLQSPLLKFKMCGVKVQIESPVHERT